jgi:hypothetical protein
VILHSISMIGWQLHLVLQCSETEHLLHTIDLIFAKLIAQTNDYN